MKGEIRTWVSTEAVGSSFRFTEFIVVDNGFGVGAIPRESLGQYRPKAVAPLKTVCP